MKNLTTTLIVDFNTLLFKSEDGVCAMYVLAACGSWRRPAYFFLS